MNTIYNKAAIKAADKIDQLILFIVSNSPIDEEWKEIEWTDSRYFISNKGRVISLCNRQPKILKPFICNNYECVSICGYDRKIHRLVAQAFLDNPDNKPIAHHKNHHKRENSLTNLSWATHKENTEAYQEYKKQKKDTAAAL